MNKGIPPGWDYNPSTWNQRIPIIILAMVGFGIATYLALFQLKIIPSVWEPFFGDGSVNVLTSKVSKILPVPDGAIGAFAYLVDAVTGVIGDKNRYRTLPWMVVVFGVAVGPLGIVSVLLVILQPVLFDSFCTLCLCSAMVSITMIGPAMDETLASLQYLKRVKNAGYSSWSAFWGNKEIAYKVK